MTRTDLAVVAKSAALSLLLTLPVVLPAAVSAGPDKIVQLGLAERAPALEVGGATLTVALGKPHYEAGEKIALVATVTNPTDAPVHVAAKVQLVRVPFSSPMSRMRAMPTSTYEAPVVLDLKPGETRVVRLATDVKMGNGDGAQVLASVPALDKSVIVASAAIGEVQDIPGLGRQVGLVRVAPEPDVAAPDVAAPAPSLPGDPSAAAPPAPTDATPTLPEPPDAPTHAAADGTAAPAVAAVEK